MAHHHEVAALMAENERLRKVINAIDGLFDLGQGKHVRSVKIDWPTWQKICSRSE